MRKANLARLPARRPDGISVNPSEQGEIGPDQFRKACEFGLEGLFRSIVTAVIRVKSKHWIKVESRQHQAFERVISFFDARSDIFSCCKDVTGQNLAVARNPSQNSEREL